MKQAKATGEFLNEYFLENGYAFDKLIIECSPFLRCMMTAGQIAQGLIALEIVGETDITINYLATDVLSKNRYREDPMRQLEFVKYDGNYQFMQYEKPLYTTPDFFPDNVNFVESAQDAAKEEVLEAYPEPQKAGQRRGLRLIESVN